MKQSITLDLISEALKSRTPISFVKQGDGEDNCMNGVRGANCDGHPYSDVLGFYLRRAFVFLKSLPEVHVIPFEDQAQYNILLHRTDNDLNKLKEFYVGIRNLDRPKVLVSSSKMIGAATLLKATFIETHPNNAYSEYERMLEQCNKYLADGVIYMFCCGMPAKVLIVDLIKQNRNISCLDLGSAFDPLFYGYTRTVQASQTDLIALYKDVLNEKTS